MKITINSNALSQALSTAISVLNSKHILPICDNVMFDATDPDDTKIHMTDGNNFISIKVNFTSDQNDKFLVNYLELYNYLKLLPETPIFLKHDPENLITVVTLDKREQTKIPGDDPDNFLFALAQVSGTPEVSVIVDSEHLEKAVDIAYRFLAKDEIGPLLYCYLNFSGEAIQVISTNRHVVSQCTLSAKSNEGSILVGEEFKRLTKELSGDASIVIHNRKYRVFDDRIDFFASHADEKYPDTTHLIKYPSSFIKVDRKELLSAVKKAEIFSNKEDRRAEFKVDKGKLKVSSVDVMTNKSFDTEIACVNDGIQDPFSIYFRLSYMEECLNVYNDDHVKIHLNNNRSKPAYILTENSGIFLLIMPVIPPEDILKQENDSKAKPSTV